MRNDTCGPLRTQDTSTPRMTFAEFQASRKEVKPHSAEARKLGYQANDEADTLLLYADGQLYIEKGCFTIHVNANPVLYYLIVERSEYMSNDLAELERELYRYGIEAGVIEGKDIKEESSCPHSFKSLRTAET